MKKSFFPPEEVTKFKIKQAQSLCRIGKKHSHKRRHQPVEAPVELEGLCIPNAHGIKTITQHACGTTTVHRMR